MSKKCLYCYQKLKDDEKDFHQSCCVQFFETKEPPSISYSLNEMSELAKNVVERSIAVPGVQPKLSMSLVNDIIEGEKKERLTIVGALGGNYILKPPVADYPEMPQNEHLTMRMAESFGIPVVPSSLIRLQSGELSYITKRIDRKANGEKIHMLDMLQITEAFDKYKSSMEKVGKALGAYSDNTLLDKLYLFELTLFCFVTGNNDMHLKNFSMMRRNENWIFAPAYDLLNVAVVNPEDTEELALTLSGKKRKLKREHFETFGQQLGLNERQIKGTFVRLLKNKNKGEHWIDQSFLSEKYKELYIDLLNKRYGVLFEHSSQRD